MPTPPQSLNKWVVGVSMFRFQAHRFVSKVMKWDDLNAQAPREKVLSHPAGGVVSILPQK